MFENQSYIPTYPNNMYKNSILWVQGIEGAKAFQLMPNSNAILMDSENDDIFYIKNCDNIGMCTLRKFKYQECIEEPQKKVDMSAYVTKAELESYVNNLLGGTSNG